MDDAVDESRRQAKETEFERARRQHARELALEVAGRVYKGTGAISLVVIDAARKYEEFLRDG